MATIPYAQNAAGIDRLLTHIQESGVPGKVTGQYLKSVGFKSSNDIYLISLFKAIGFLSSNGVPTDTWTAYRNKGKSGAVLAEAIRRGYPELFSTYPEAHRKDDEAILNFFASNSTLGKPTLALAVRSFKALCAKADFDAAAPILNREQSATEAGGVSNITLPPLNQQGSPSVTINIELQIPPTDNPAVYENLFAAMKKHLFP